MAPNVAALAPSEAEDYFAVAKTEGIEVYLSNKPCPEDLARTYIKPEFQPLYKALRVIADDAFYRGCYRAHEESYLMFLENGERGAAPKAAFEAIQKPTY